MRKSTLFVSTALTVFMLAVMAGAVSAYQKIAQNTDVATPVTAEPVTQPTATLEPAPTAPTVPAVISPEQATSIAVAFMADSNVYGVEVVDYEGVPAFLITFSSGKLIYVSPAGEILAISEVKPVIVEAPRVWVGSPDTGNGGSGGGGESGEQEDHDDDHNDD